MGDLSEHFNKAEFEDRTTHECNMNPKLITALEQLRAILGRPITINSGYRSPSTNAAVGGVGHSQHMLGDAADLKIPDGKGGWLSTWELLALAEEVEAFRDGGIGVYPENNDFIHLDVRDGRARWARRNDVYVKIWEGM